VIARVLVTRPAGTWPALAARFHGTPVLLQLTETTTEAEPIDGRPGDDALDRLDRTDWLVATSGRGVLALAARLAARGVTAFPPGLRIAAVGPATARALFGIGARVDLIADDASSDGLAALLGRRLAVGARVVLVRPEGVEGSLATALRAGGAAVDEAPLYRTIARESSPMRRSPARSPVWFSPRPPRWTCGSTPQAYAATRSFSR
jgi:uroporphyrinogen-III synthase